mmetsp:Transcript_1734/g.2733  ORF Transcript_1734/g.2733 Transcript_1734/m.2733 type:complete len:452 (+) Transcript_1734:55-1410(+)
MVLAVGGACAMLRARTGQAFRSVGVPVRHFSQVGSGKMMEGMMVLELATVLAGPSVGQFLGELGARVIKVESPKTHGDVTRTWKLPMEGDDVEISAYFSSCNVGKESIVIDMATDQGKQVVHDLAAKADCVVVNYKPGDAEKLGVDYETLSKLNERLIYGQITGYGLDDKRVGYDAVIQAESGLQYMNGTPDTEPCKLPLPLVDIIGAHMLKQGILVELWRRERTGRGGMVNASLANAAIATLVNQGLGYLREGVVPQRIGSDHPTIVPYGTVFATKDPNELLTIAVGSDKQFRSLCEVLGHPDLADPNGKYAHNPSRCKHRDELKASLRELFAQHSRSELLQKLADHRIPCGPVNDLRDAFKQHQAEELVVFADDEPRERSPDQNPLPFPNRNAVGVRQAAFKGIPEGLDGTCNLSRPPKYGEHTEQILREVLGYDTQKIETLMQEGTTA